MIQKLIWRCLKGTKLQNFTSKCKKTEISPLIWECFKLCRKSVARVNIWHTMSNLLWPRLHYKTWIMDGWMMGAAAPKQIRWFLCIVKIHYLSSYTLFHFTRTNRVLCELTEHTVFQAADTGMDSTKCFFVSVYEFKLDLITLLIKIIECGLLCQITRHKHVSRTKKDSCLLSRASISITIQRNINSPA